MFDVLVCLMQKPFNKHDTYIFGSQYAQWVLEKGLYGPVPCSSLLGNNEMQLRIHRGRMKIFEPDSRVECSLIPDLNTV